MEAGGQTASDDKRRRARQFQMDDLRDGRGKNCWPLRLVNVAEALGLVEIGLGQGRLSLRLVRFPTQGIGKGIFWI